MLIRTLWEHIILDLIIRFKHILLTEKRLHSMCVSVIYHFPVSRVGYNIKKAITEEFFYKDRESQITAIEKTFAKAKEEV